MADLKDITESVLENLQTGELLDIHPDGDFRGRIYALAEKLMFALFEEVQQSDAYGFRTLSKTDYLIANAYQPISFSDLVNQLISDYSKNPTNSFFDTTFEAIRKRDGVAYQVKYGTALRSGFFHMLKETVKMDRGRQLKNWERFLTMSICTSNWTMPQYFTKTYKNNVLAPWFLGECLNEYEKKESKKAPKYAKWLVESYPQIQQPVFRLFKQDCLLIGLNKLASLLAEAYANQVGNTVINIGLFENLSTVDRGKKQFFFQSNFTEKMLKEDFTSTINYYDKNKEKKITLQPKGRKSSSGVIKIGGTVIGGSKKPPSQKKTTQKQTKKTTQRPSIGQSQDFKLKMIKLTASDTDFVTAVKTLVTKLQK